MKHLILALALLSIGCGPVTGAPESMMLDSAFYPVHARIIRESVAEWARATDSDIAFPLIPETLPEGPRTVEQFDDGPPRFLAASRTDPVYAESNRDGPSSGHYSYQSGSIVLYLDAFALKPGDGEPELRAALDRFRRVVMHELGHLHGLEHAASGIMAQSIVPQCQVGCVDQAALDAYCAEYECGPNAGSTCQ